MSSELVKLYEAFGHSPKVSYMTPPDLHLVAVGDLECKSWTTMYTFGKH